MAGSDKSAGGWVESHPSLAAELPAGEFKREELPEYLVGYHEALVKTGVIRKVRRCEGCPKAWVWRVSGCVRERVDGLREGYSGWLPCGHDSLRNPRDCEGLECGVCGVGFSREQVEG